MIRPDVSISSSLIGLRDNASCEFSTRWNFSTCVEGAIEAYIVFAAHCITLPNSCDFCGPCKLACICIFALTLYVIYFVSIIKFAFGVHTTNSPKHQKFLRTTNFEWCCVCKTYLLFIYIYIYIYIYILNNAYKFLSYQKNLMQGFSASQSFCYMGSMKLRSAEINLLSLKKVMILFVMCLDCIFSLPFISSCISWESNPWAPWIEHISSRGGKVHRCHVSVHTSVRGSRFDTISVQQEKKKSTMLGFFSFILNRQ